MSTTVGLIDHYRACAGYNARFNRQLFDLVAELPPDVRTRDAGAFFGSIEATLNHILLADRIWLGRFRNSGSSFPALEEADLVYAFSSLRDTVAGDFATLAAERIATDQVILAWIEDLTDEALTGTLRYRMSNGTEREHALWIAVSHLFNHQTHHRGQVTTLLSQAGVDPGVTDLLVFTLAR
jgi:uncharacterized damage-inducible protein DinB